MLTNRNTHWQNKMNLASGIVVVIGLIASMVGFVLMDQLAAAVVGSILVAMGVELIKETRENLSVPIKRYFRPTIISSMLVSATLVCISLSIRL